MVSASFVKHSADSPLSSERRLNRGLVSEVITQLITNVRINPDNRDSPGSRTRSTLLSNTNEFPPKPRDAISPVCPGSVRLLPRSTCQEHVTYEASRRHLASNIWLVARHSRSSASITLCMPSFMTPTDLLRLPSSSNQLVIVPTFRVLTLTFPSLFSPC